MENKQVFYSSSPKRWKIFLNSLKFFIVIGIILLLVLIFALFKSSNILIPRISNSNEIYNRVLNPEHITTFKTSQNIAFKEQQVKLKKQLELEREKVLNNRKKKNDKDNEIRAGFYVTWDPQSFHTLKNNIDKMNMVFPEWLFLSPSGDSVITGIDDRGLELMRKYNVKIMPMLSNYINNAWNSGSIHKLITSKEHKKKFINNLVKILKQNNFAGLNVDFEALNVNTDEEIVNFQKELYEALHKNNLLLTQDVPPYNTDYNLKSLAKYNDYIVLMAYDMHYAQSTPGPVSPIDWFESSIDYMLKEIPNEKLIIGVPTYGYDWPDKKEGLDVPYEEAIVTAKESEGAIKFDKANYNLTYDYYDDYDLHHNVWFTDAATCLNMMRVGSEYYPAGFALWRLGGEDKRIWEFYSNSFVQDKLDKNNISMDKIENITPSYDVDFKGEGEVIKVLSVPDSGKINVDFNKTGFIIDDEKYLNLPSNYLMEKFGGTEKEVVLSFDDGPDENYTPKILDILKENNIHADFFVIGMNAERNLNVLKRLYDEGHEIGNHTFSHPNLSEISPDLGRLELNATRKIIESVTGHSTILFRPPYNADAEPTDYDEIYPIVLASRANYLFVGESIDPRDWDASTTADSIFERVKQQVDLGHIILLHDAGGNRDATIKALPLIIKYFKDKGYKFVTASELIGSKRDDVMPPLTDYKDLYFAKVNWTIAEILYWTEIILYAFFQLAIFAAVLRISFISTLALIHKWKSKKRKTLPRNDLASVIIPAYNEEVNINRTIENILQNTYSNMELIFVDDGSKDSTLDKVKGKYSNNDKIKIFTKQNGGKASALNYGIERASGEFLVCIDADTILKKDAIENLMSSFTDPSIAAVAGNVKVGNEINLLTKWQAIEYFTSQNLDRRAFDIINCITVVPGAIGAFRKDAVIKCGVFTTDTLAEDCDITIRLLKEGLRIVYCSKAVAYTEAPETVKMFLKQRFRWSFGIMQSLWKHKDLLFSPHAKQLGLVALPNMLVFQFFLPLFSPIVDFMLVFSLLFGEWQKVLIFYLFFLIIDMVSSSIAMWMESENIKRILYLIPQRIIYRQLLFFVLVKSIMTALKGTLTGWGILKRTGKVKVAS